MAHSLNKKYVSTALIIVATLLCILSFAISDYMYELAFTKGQNPMTATEILNLRKFNDMLPGILHKYSTYFSTPGAFIFLMIEFGIYSAPILAVFLVRKWITIQLIVVAEIAALLKYSIGELLTVQMATANGCSGCEALGFGQAMFSFAILLSSLVFFFIANLLEKNFTKREA